VLADDLTRVVKQGLSAPAAQLHAPAGL